MGDTLKTAKQCFMAMAAEKRGKGGVFPGARMQDTKRRLRVLHSRLGRIWNRRSLRDSLVASVHERVDYVAHERGLGGRDHLGRMFKVLRPTRPLNLE
jgi:hypothetical protein